MQSGYERRSVVVRRGSCESRPCCAKRILFGRARRVRRTARARPNRVHKIWAARADQFDPSRFLPGARVYINHYAFLSFGAGPRGCIGSARNQKMNRCAGITNDVTQPLDSIVAVTVWDEYGTI